MIAMTCGLSLDASSRAAAVVLLGGLILLAQGCGDGAANLEAMKRLEAQQERLAKSATDLQRAAEGLSASVAEVRQALGAVSKQVDDTVKELGTASSTVSGQSASVAGIRSSLDDASKRLEATATALARGGTVRAVRSVELAKQALEAGKLSEAVLLMTSAALAEPSEPAHALRLAELAAADPSATPESLSAAATTLRVLAVQCSGESVLSVWRAADALDAKRSELLDGVAKADAARAAQELQQAREAACVQLSELIASDFVSAGPAARAELFQRLTDALADSGDLCDVARDGAYATLGRWQRIVRFDDALKQVERALLAIDREKQAGRGSGHAAEALLASADAALQMLWTVSPEEVGPARWEAAGQLQDWYGLQSKAILDARDAETLARADVAVRAALEAAAAVRERNGTHARFGQRSYATVIKQVQDAIAALQADSRTLAAKRSLEKIGTHQVALQRELRALADVQYRSLCSHVSDLLTKQIDLAMRETEISEADALNFAEPLYVIDPTSMPGPLAESYGGFWRMLEAECYDAGKFKMLRGRIESTRRVTVEEF